MPALTDCRGSLNPCWSTRKSQVRSAERERAPTTKNLCGSNHRAHAMMQLHRNVCARELSAKDLKINPQDFKALQKDKQKTRKLRCPKHVPQASLLKPSEPTSPFSLWWIFLWSPPVVFLRAALETSAAGIRTTTGSLSASQDQRHTK